MADVWRRERERRRERQWISVGVVALIRSATVQLSGSGVSNQESHSPLARSNDAPEPITFTSRSLTTCKLILFLDRP